MSHNTAESQAKMYLYDIHNCARENGFKAEDKWQVCLASDDEKITIVNKYNPTISVKMAPAILSEVFDLVKEKLQQAKSEVEQAYTKESIRVNQLHHLIAFSEKKMRRH